VPRPVGMSVSSLHARTKNILSDGLEMFGILEVKSTLFSNVRCLRKKQMEMANDLEGGFVVTLLSLCWCVGKEHVDLLFWLGWFRYIGKVVENAERTRLKRE
jgi:hypothetical protein